MRKRKYWKLKILDFVIGTFCPKQDVYPVIDSRFWLILMRLFLVLIFVRFWLATSVPKNMTSFSFQFAHRISRHVFLLSSTSQIFTTNTKNNTHFTWPLSTRFYSFFFVFLFVCIYICLLSMYYIPHFRYFIVCVQLNECLSEII